MKKKIISCISIRPDFIRMAEILKGLDASKELEHIEIHTGQHFSELLSDVFFRELDIRKPDYNLGCGAPGKAFHQQIADLNEKLLQLLHHIKPDMIMFLGDSNSVVSSFYIRREFGNSIKIAHIEAGMRSFDRRMPEEINRTVCDHCSDILFVYHYDYKTNLIRENIHTKSKIYVVGNTIVEVCNKYSKELMLRPKANSHIILDIHRPENFKYPERMKNILSFASTCANKYSLPVYFLKFERTWKYLEQYGINPLTYPGIFAFSLLSYKDFLALQRDALFMISDSGTAQEEPALLATPVIVPRDYTERPQSIENDCSIMLDVNSPANDSLGEALRWFENKPKMKTEWLGDGKTAQRIVETLENML